MRATPLQRLLSFIVGWGAALLLFFPIAWMVLTSFKSERDATSPGLFFAPSLDAYREVFARADYLSFALNSVVISVGGTVLALLFAIPAAYAMAFHPTQRTRGTLLWMLSTKMLPPVGVLVPIYLLFRTAGLLDTRSGLVMIYALMNLPIVVWMLFTFYKEVPNEILEAGRMDGAQDRGRGLVPAAAADVARRCLDRAAVADPVLERGVLEPEPDVGGGRAADRVHCLVLQSRGVVLRQAVRGIDDGRCADPGVRLVQPASTRARPDLRRGEIERDRL